MKYSIQENDGPVRNIDNCTGLVKDQRDMLKAWRKKRPEDEDNRHIDLDIRVYEFILAQDNPEKAAREYFKKRAEIGALRKTVMVPKIDVARALGWAVE